MYGSSSWELTNSLVPVRSTRADPLVVNWNSNLGYVGLSNRLTMSRLLSFLYLTLIRLFEFCGKTASAIFSAAEATSAKLPICSLSLRSAKFRSVVFRLCSLCLPPIFF